MSQQPATKVGEEHHLWLHSVDGFVTCPAEPDEICGYIQTIVAIELEAATLPEVPAARIIRQVRGAIHGQPALDVVRLAAALDNVDRDYEQGWTPAHYARAIAAEYASLSGQHP